MASSAPQSEQSTLIARFSEITLKGQNRSCFEKQMQNNVRLHLAGHGCWNIRRSQAGLQIEGREDAHKILDILRGLPGIANVGLARWVSREPQALAETVKEYTATVLQKPGLPRRRPPSFKVKISRKDKRYPLNSMELAACLGGHVQKCFPQLQVDLEDPDFTIMLEIWEHAALLFEKKQQGPGGLAVGSSGKALCLFSGGIDSPVAAYLMMTRGSPVVFLHFHSFPFIGEQSKEKVFDAVRLLARYQPHSRLYVAPFAKIQLAIRDHCPEHLRTVLYRRMMNRVANAVVVQEGALALVTGESLGQVASQTMENIFAIAQTADYPILQPLIGLSKEKIVTMARHIGSYSISIQPQPDCCTLFQPRHPETRSKLAPLHAAEAPLPIEALVAECVAGLERSDYGPQYYPLTW